MCYTNYKTFKFAKDICDQLHCDVIAKYQISRNGQFYGIFKKAKQEFLK